MSKKNKKTDEKEEVEKYRKEIKTLKNKLELEKKRADENLKKLMYLQAEFENYKKRVDKEFENKKLNYSSNLFKKIIPTIDELEIALSEAKKLKKADLIAQGLQLIIDKFKKTLFEEGLTEIEAKGKIFDPMIHEAVQIENSKKYPNNYIIEELRKGYKLNGHLIRPSMVKICRNTEGKNGGA